MRPPALLQRGSPGGGDRQDADGEERGSELVFRNRAHKDRRDDVERGRLPERVEARPIPDLRERQLAKQDEIGPEQKERARGKRGRDDRGEYA